MSGGVFGGLWRFGRCMRVFDSESLESRSFRGFLEPMSLTEHRASARKRPALLPQEKFRLIAEPGEDFYGGKAVRVFCGGEEFELLAVKELYFEEQISHRECVLLRVGEVKADA